MCFAVVCIPERKLRLMKIGQTCRKCKIARKEMLDFTLVNSNAYDALKLNKLARN